MKAAVLTQYDKNGRKTCRYESGRLYECHEKRVKRERVGESK